MSSTSAQRKVVTDALDSVDWNFENSGTSTYSVNSFHWFPGNFIPQIPSYLIQILSKTGEVVFDPFCGSGTTGVESLLLGRECILSDACQAAVQVSRGKLASIAIDDPSEIYRRYEDRLVLDMAFGKCRPRNPTSRNEHEIMKWFSEQTLHELLQIWDLCESETNAQFDSILEMVFSDVIFSCASTRGSKTRTGKRRRHHWGWVADNVRPTELVDHPAFEYFRDKLYALSMLAKPSIGVNYDGNRVVHNDARSTSLESESVDVIVTSPPYLGMIDYVLANRLIYDWMGWDMENEFLAEIGPRRARNRKDCVAGYIDAMKLVVAEMRRVLKGGGYCAIVIGASRKFPGCVDQVVDLFTQQFELIWGPRSRSISRRRVSRVGRENHEVICVFQ